MECVGLSLLETPFTTKQAAEILTLDPHVTCLAAADGSLKKSVCLSQRQHPNFCFHGYYDLVEFKLISSQARNLSNEKDRRNAIENFLRRWTALLAQDFEFDGRTDTIPMQLCQRFCSELSLSDCNQIGFYSELLCVNPNYRFSTGNFAYFCCAVALAVLKSTMEYFSSQYLRARY